MRPAPLKMLLDGNRAAGVSEGEMIAQAIDDAAVDGLVAHAARKHANFGLSLLRQMNPQISQKRLRQGHYGASEWSVRVQRSVERRVVEEVRHGHTEKDRSHGWPPQDLRLWAKEVKQRGIVFDREKLRKRQRLRWRQELTLALTKRSMAEAG